MATIFPFPPTPTVGQQVTLADGVTKMVWTGYSWEVVPVPYTLPMPISDGGTGATTVPGARSNLGLGSDGPVSGFRNRLINGNFVVNQRVQDFTVGSGGVISGQVTSDCWRINAVNGGRVIFEPNIGPGGEGQVYFSRESGSGTVALFNRVEAINWRNMAGGKAVLSFDLARMGALTTQTLTANVITTDGETGFVNAVVRGVQSNIAPTVNGVWQRVSVPVDFISVGSQLGLYVELVAVGVGTNASTNNISVRRVQLETGTSATPFEFRPLDAEIRLCERYFEIINLIGLRKTDAAGSHGGGLQTFQMRAIKWTTSPTITLWTNARGAGTQGSLVVNAATLSSAFVSSADNRTAHIWNGGALVAVGDYASGSMTISAEIPYP